MNLAVGCDERLPVVEQVLDYLKEKGHNVQYYGPQDKENAPWPKVGRVVAEDVSAGRAQEGILFCWTGTGMSIAANKVRGIRAALCADAETARGARLWNNANVLCLSMRATTGAVAKEILDAWFNTRYMPNTSDDESLQMLDDLDRQI